MDNSQEIAHINAIGAPQPWAAGSRNLYLRLPWTEISGRQLGLHWDPLSEPPAHPPHPGRGEAVTVAVAAADVLL